MDQGKSAPGGSRITFGKKPEGVPYAEVIPQTPKARARYASIRAGRHRSAGFRGSLAAVGARRTPRARPTARRRTASRRPAAASSRGSPDDSSGEPPPGADDGTGRPGHHLSVDHFERVTDGLAAELRAELFFELLDPEHRDDFFASLAAECTERRERERCGEEVQHRRPRVGRLWRQPKFPRRRELRSGAGSSRDGDSPLLEIAPAVYVEALTGCPVPPGGMIRCPLPGHEDRWPSFKVYDEPERGVWCFGCQRGGDLIAFAAALWGCGTRGEDFKALRRRLADTLLRRVAA